MTAYAAIVSLMNVLNRVQHPTCPVTLDQSQMAQLHDDVCFLADFLELYSESTSKDLERDITDAANSVEDIIESLVLDQSLASYEANKDVHQTSAGFSKSSALFCQDLKKAIEEIDLLVDEAIDIINEDTDDPQASSMGSLSIQSNECISSSALLQSSDEPESKKSRFTPQDGYGEIFKDPLVSAVTPTPMARQHNSHKFSSTGISITATSSTSSTGTNNMVGFDDQLNSLMKLLIVKEASRQVIPIVGMGGSGKSTLARNIYDHQHVVRHFDIRAWVTISQHYVVKDILIALLRNNITGSAISHMDDQQLEDQVHKCLWARTYLVILDDIWSSQAWNDIRRFFPDNRNGSRILVTTRLFSVALAVRSSSIYRIKLLDTDKSWDLLSETVFGKDIVPSQLETLGKEIANACKGLPLAILVIGGLLKMSKNTPECWTDVARNVRCLLSTGNDGHCMKVLSLSYNELPVHLKPCFLYMAAFKEDDVIRVSNLTKLWVAEGFLRPAVDRTLEDVALDNLYELIGRHLIMIRTLDINDKIESCTIHDLLREFCLREAQNVKFMRRINKDKPNFPQRLEGEGCLVYQSYDNEIYPYLLKMPDACSPLNSWSRPKSLVLNADNSEELFIDTTQLFNLRYLKIQTHWPEKILRLLSSTSLLWNLETLIISGPDKKTIIPFEFWDLPNIRHLMFFMKVARPHHKGRILENLQTLSGIENFNFTDDVIKLIPNLKELYASYSPDPFLVDSILSRSLTNLARLPKLERLTIQFEYNWVNVKRVFKELENVAFSPNLKELTLRGSNIPWKNMTIIGSLPNLQVLHISVDACYGDEWNTIDGEFLQLRFLSIWNSELSIWNAESSHFPRLEHLVLCFFTLEEIPSGIGDVPSLELIELEYPSTSVVISAKKILDEQQYQGNFDLLIKVVCDWSSEEEWLELKKMATDNFQVTFAENI